MTDRSVVVNRASSNTPPVCIVCGEPTKPFKNGKDYEYPKTCSPECLSKLRSEISKRNKHRVRWNSRPQERPSQYLEEVAERDYIEGVLR